jgi:hypothetical protein
MWCNCFNRDRSNKSFKSILYSLTLVIFFLTKFRELDKLGIQKCRLDKDKVLLNYKDTDQSEFILRTTKCKSCKTIYFQIHLK